MSKYFLLLSIFIMLPASAEAGDWDPVTVSAHFSPSSADEGEKVTFYWNSTNSFSCDIKGLPGKTWGKGDGSHTFVATANLKAIVICEGRDDHLRDRATATLTLILPEPTDPTDPPTITEFNVPTFFYRHENNDRLDSSNIWIYGRDVSWKTENADECQIKTRERHPWSPIPINHTFQNFVFEDGSGLESEKMLLKCSNTHGETEEFKDYEIRPDPYPNGGGNPPIPAPTVGMSTSACSYCDSTGIFVHVNAQNADSCIFNTVGFNNFSIPTTTDILVTVFNPGQLASATCTGPGGTSTGRIYLYEIPGIGSLNNF